MMAIAKATNPARNQTMCGNSELGSSRPSARHIKTARIRVPIISRNPACSNSARGASAIISVHPARVVQRLIPVFTE